MTNDVRLPLDGIRVLDFTNMLSGPYCTRLLADLGAEVIKVEPPAGDHNRARRPVRSGHSSFFGQLNAGKRSIVLDLKTKAGVEAALDIAAKSDVVVENWRPGVAHRLGVGFDQVSALRPDTIYCSISGFGQTGPKSQRPAYAPIVHAASGYDLAQVEYQGGGRPANTAIFIGDVFGGMSSFAAIQTALLDRERTGRGRFIDVSMLDGMMNLMVFETLEIQTPSPIKLRVYQPLEASDGFIVVAPTSQKNFEKLAHCLERPEWLSDPRFKATKIREEHWDELMRLIESWTRQRSAQNCEETLLAAGVPCTRYLKVGEAMKDPQIVARGTFTPLTDDAGTYLVPSAPYQFADMPTPVRNEVPKLGEHTEHILAEFSGARTKRGI